VLPPRPQHAVEKRKSQRKDIYSGKKTPPSAYITQLLQKEKYDTKDCPVIPSPGVKINHRPHFILSPQEKKRKTVRIYIPGQPVPRCTF
jgi:hypothetical protein